jgi:hypothetical protein
MVFVPLGIVVRRKVFSFPVVSAISEFNMVAAYGMIETFLDVESDLRPCGGKLHISLVTHTTPPCTTPAVVYDPESVTEPESEPETHTIPTVVCITPKPKKKDWTDFFATPSPPSPTSNYWKYVTREEDAAWYDRAGTDDSFHVVRQMKRELCDTK